VSAADPQACAGIPDRAIKRLTLRIGLFSYSTKNDAAGGIVRMEPLATERGGIRPPT
jgi:hypothetical protein